MRLLIADDDDYTREGLVETINWAEFGIERVLQARDGQEAARIAAAEKPDIVLTDIRMPKLNGIEFAEKLVQLCPDSQLIFMSGYMEVDYLKSAIRLAAVDFIEKPIKIAEVEQAMGKTLLQLKERTRLMAVRDEKIGLQRRQLVDLLAKELLDKDQVVRLCNDIGFPQQGIYMTLAVCDRSSVELGEDVIQEVVRFWGEHGFPAVANVRGADGLLVVVACSKPDAMRVRYLIERFAERSRPLVTGIGKDAVSLEQVQAGGRSALHAAQMFFYAPNRHCFRHEECDSGERDEERQTALLAELYKLLRDEPEQLPEWLDRLCSRFIGQRAPDKPAVVKLFSTFAETMLAESSSMQTMMEIVEPTSVLRTCRSMDEVRKYMIRLAEIFVADAGSTSGYTRLIQDVIRYIGRNYDKAELDLNEIAEHAHLSTAHLGVLFKQETGTTIKQFIGDYRIDMAKKLILNGHYKINEIAEKCGYGSASYFAKAFKTATDLTPLDFKRNSQL